MKHVLICGGGGFIGHALAKRLKRQEHDVTVIDRKAHPGFEDSPADDYICFDLRRQDHMDHLDQGFDEIYQLAAEVGGLGYIMDRANDAEVYSNSIRINLNLLDAATRMAKTPKIFFASSACVYPSLPSTSYDDNKSFYVPANRACKETDVPAPDNAYAWEKLFAEQLYQAYALNHGIPVRIGRFHNVFGPVGTYKGGREKFPAALCRKVAECAHGGSIDIWGTGQQTRSFMYIEDALEGMTRLMESDFDQPVNIGSSQMVTIEQTALQVIAMSQKAITINHVEGPVGVMGRNSDNSLIQKVLGWSPNYNLEAGLHATYQWVAQQIARERAKR